MNNPFEEYARDQFEQHEVPVDVESLWEEVYPKVKEEKKHRKFFWFFLTGFLLATGVFGTFYFMQNGEGTESIENTASVLLSETQRNLEETATASDKLANTDVDNNNMATNSSTSETVSDNSNQSKANEVSKTTVVKSENQRKVPSSAKQSKTARSQTRKAIDTNNNTTTDKSNPDNNTANTNIPTRPTLEPTPNLTIQTNKPNTTATTVTNAINTESSFLLQSLRASLFSYDFLQHLSYPELKKMDERKDDYPSNKFTKGMRFGIGAYAGISKSSSDLSAEGENAAEYLNLRNGAEKQLETLHFGLSAIVQSKQNIYLRTGLEYTRIASLFKKESTISTTESMPGIVEIRINNITGDTTEIMGELKSTTTETYRKKTFNYFHLVDVPVILGYNFGDDQWQIGLEAGIHVNVLLKRKGEIFAYEEGYYDIDTDERSWYKTNVGVTPYIGVNGAYNISDFVQVHVTPGFQFKTLYTTGDYLLKERLASLGVRAGVRYLF